MNKAFRFRSRTALQGGVAGGVVAAGRSLSGDVVGTGDYGAYGVTGNRTSDRRVVHAVSKEL